MSELVDTEPSFSSVFSALGMVGSLTALFLITRIAFKAFILGQPPPRALAGIARAIGVRTLHRDSQPESESRAHKAADLNLPSPPSAAPAAAEPAAPRAALDPKLAEECWTLTLSSLLALTAWTVQLHTARRTSCGLRSTLGCIADYPAAHAMTTLESRYIALEAAYYVFMVLREPLGVGLGDRWPMRLHHLLSLTLLAAVGVLRLQRIAILSLALLSTTNPLLHASRIAAHQKLPRARAICFGLFTITWVAMRLVLFPLTVLRCVAVEVWPAIEPLTREDSDSDRGRPWMGRHLLAIHRFFSLGLLALFMFQLYWTSGIVTVLARLATQGGDRASDEARAYEQREAQKAAAERERRSLSPPEARMLYRVEEEELALEGALEEDDTTRAYVDPDDDTTRLVAREPAARAFKKEL